MFMISCMGLGLEGLGILRFWDLLLAALVVNGSLVLSTHLKQKQHALAFKHFSSKLASEKQEGTLRQSSQNP